MNLRTYTLSVSFAAIIGLLISVLPLVHSALEYHSPEFVEPQPELASLEIFVLAKNKLAGDEMLKTWRYAEQMKFYMVRFWERDEWQAMYDAAKKQHLEGVRRRAYRTTIAYGTLCGLCLVLHTDINFQYHCGEYERHRRDPGILKEAARILYTYQNDAKLLTRNKTKWDRATSALAVAQIIASLELGMMDRSGNPAEITTLSSWYRLGGGFRWSLKEHG
jgi:hypothetical protein